MFQIQTIDTDYFHQQSANNDTFSFLKGEFLSGAHGNVLLGWASDLAPF